MMIIPPKEIMNYVTFKNGEVVAREGLPEELLLVFEEFKRNFNDAKASERRRLEKICINETNTDIQ